MSSVSKAVRRHAAAAALQMRKKIAASFNLPVCRHCLAICDWPRNVMPSAIGYCACQVILNPEIYRPVILVRRCTVTHITTLQ